RLAHEQEQTPVSRNSVLQACEQHFALPLTADERPARAIGRSLLLDEVKSGILVEDRLLEFAQLTAGFDAQLVDEHFAGVVVRLERLGVSTRAAERHPQLPTQALAPRL